LDGEQAVQYHDANSDKDEDISADIDDGDDENSFIVVQKYERKGNTQPINRTPSTPSTRTMLTVYVKGHSANIEKEARRKPHEFKREITNYCGQVEFIEARNNHVSK